MRSVQRFTYFALSLTLIGLCLFSIAPIQAQDEASQPAPQFLYRDDTRLILVNGYTGETTELPFEVDPTDRFVWSPDGRYLLTWIHDENDIPCLNLYDVDTLHPLYDQPIACEAYYFTFSADSTRIVYTTSDNHNGILWLYNVENGTGEEIHRTNDGTELRPAGIQKPAWSPTETYLTFVEYSTILGGTVNSLVVMNVASGEYVPVYAPNAYYASFYPIWSADDRWFLITLQDQYVTSGTLPLTNHKGDVYLVNSDTGEKYRLSYTPAEYEYDLHWTDEGGIVFKTTQVITHDFTLDQAMNVPEVPAEDIVWPEPYEDKDFYDPRQGVMLVFPDWSLGVWKTAERTPEGTYEDRLDLGLINDRFRETYHSYSLSDSHELIGWRPSNGKYLQESPYAAG